MKRVTIISTGVANIASITAAFRRLGADVILSDDASTIRDAERVVLPGVGSFGAGMAMLRAHKLRDAIAVRLADDRPLLAVCLGMQLLCTSSEESPGVEGLGLIDALARRFTAGVRVPQFGWNRVMPDNGCLLLEAGYAYFANSYRIERAPDSWSCALASHGSPFIAAMERGSALACQFHPELSGDWGMRLLERWLVGTKAVLPC